MKKGLITFVLTVVTIVFVWAQTGKPQQKPQPKKQSTAQPSAAYNPQASIARGKEVYGKFCVSCHQKDGGGVHRLNPPIIKTEYVLGDKARLIRIILKGMNQPIEIEDEEYTNPMPAQPHLTDVQIADVLSYVRNNFGNKASIITPAEVKALRGR